MRRDASCAPSWIAATAGNASSWYHSVPARTLTRLEAAYCAQNAPEVTDLRLGPAERSAARDDLAPVLETLETGRGFVILEIPGDHSAQDLTALYWLIGQALGEPANQNVEGTLLYDVRDTGKELSQGARFSVTSYESSFHTDASFADSVIDYVGLLCLQTALSGGVNHIVSGHTVKQVLQRENPEALDVLRQPFHVERRGGVRPGESPTVARPVITDGRAGSASDRSEPIFRYLRYWIETGHEKAREPLNAVQRAALDALDEVARRPELRVEFTLKPGQVLFINNRWLLHNRTAFVDHPEPDRRRHLVRLWLTR